MSDRTRRTPKKDWAQDFLDALKATGMVTAACDEVGIGRSTVYDRRESDEEFAAAWDDIVERTTERMESEAFRRAVEGVDEPVYHQGVAVDTVKKYSDTLLIFMLKSRRPEKYRERHQVEHTGPAGGPVDVNVNLDADGRAKLADVLRRRPASSS